MNRDAVTIIMLELMIGTPINKIEAIIGLRWEVILLHLRALGATTTADALEAAAA